MLRTYDGEKWTELGDPPVSAIVGMATGFEPVDVEGPLSLGPERQQDHGVCPFLDQTLGIQRGNQGVYLDPAPGHGANEDGSVLHAAVVQTVAHEAAYWSIPGNPNCLTAEITTHMLKAATRDGGQLIGSGAILRQSSRQVVAEGRVYQAGNLLAHVVVTFAL